MNDPARSAPSQKGTGRESLVGREWPVQVGPIAHGGHFVARHEGQVVFVRHALPGEHVVARVTEGRVGDRFVRADAISVEQSSPERVDPPCVFAGPGRCGGCDFQHVALGEQRRLKAAVVHEQFSRLAGLEVEVAVAPVAGDQDGLRWRTRVEFGVDGSGRAGLRRHRSHDLELVDDCLIATSGVIDSGVLETTWHGCEAVDVVDAAHPDEPVLVPVPAPVGTAAGGGLVGEQASDGDWSGEYVLDARGFWQVHPGAASTLLTRVVALLAPQSGDRVVDLYAGSGLFTLRLGELVAPDGAVLGIEGDARAVDRGIRNTEHLDTVEWRANRVEAELRSLVAQGIAADLVVLDPPRTGAGKGVVKLIAELRPRRVVYVACDPAALARDVGLAAAQGYSLVSVEAYDLFPMTHHVECVAVLEPTH